MKTNYKLYATKDNNTVIMTVNGEIKHYDEDVRSTEFLSYFDVETVEELKECKLEDILEGYDAMVADFEYHSPLDYADHLKELPKLQLKGEVIAEYTLG